MEKKLAVKLKKLPQNHNIYSKLKKHFLEENEFLIKQQQMFPIINDVSDSIHVWLWFGRYSSVKNTDGCQQVAKRCGYLPVLQESGWGIFWFAYSEF